MSDLSVHTSEWAARVSFLEDEAGARVQAQDQIDTLRALVVSMGLRVGDLEAPLLEDPPQSDEDAGPSVAALQVGTA